MKKIITIISAILTAGSVFAQGPADALLVAENHYEGTARSMAMGNAFTALGGDMGALTINPASSGVYRCSEFAISPSFITAGGSTYFNGTSNGDSKTGFTLSNTGFITTVNTGNSSGLMNYNFGFAVNRVNSFNNTVSASGYNSRASILGSIACSVNGLDPTMLEVNESTGYEPYNNPNIPWNAILAYDCYLINPITGTNPQSYIASTENFLHDGGMGVGGRLQQDYYSKTTGGSHEFAFNFGGNWNDNLFLGVNLNLISVDYTIRDYYAEYAVNSLDFDDGFVKMTNDYWQNTSGAGFNAKFGAIWAPAGGFRLGATLTTPTWYSLTDSWQRWMTSEFDNGNTNKQESPYGSFEYKVKAPMRWSLGVAYTAGNLGLISADYECVNYGRMTMSDGNGNVNSFSDANSAIRTGLGRSDIFRLGGELLLGNTALRAGYNFYGSAGSLVDMTGTPYYTYRSSNYLSCGLGFRFGEGGRTSFDVAYQRLLGNNTESFAAFDGYEDVTAPVIDFNKKLSKLVFTLAFRF